MTAPTFIEFQDQTPEALASLEAVLQVHGQKIYWWGHCDPDVHEGCYGIMLDDYCWLVLSPSLKGKPNYFQILPHAVVGPSGE